MHDTVMTSIGQDVRHALRFGARSPAFTAAALLTIALGVGGTAAVFSVVYGVLLRPPPYGEPDRIVTVAEEHPGGAPPFGGVLLSSLTYRAWLPAAKTITALEAYSNSPGTLTGLDEPVRLRGTGITPSLVQILRLAPAQSRLFVEEDAREGAPPVAVLGYQFWRSRFGGDPSAIGRTPAIDGTAHDAARRRFLRGRSRSPRLGGAARMPGPRASGRGRRSRRGAQSRVALRSANRQDGGVGAVTSVAFLQAADSPSRVRCPSRCALPFRVAPAQGGVA